MTIRIPRTVARAIADDASARDPNEACGLIAGDGRTIRRAIPLSNLASQKSSAFALEPNEQLKALARIDAENMRWMGVYHSHPKTSTIPSTADINGVRDHGLLQLIVSLEKSKPEFQLWRVDETGVTPIELIYDTQNDSESDTNMLSKQQRAAIVVAGIISLILMLAISLSLLPSAPEIP